MCTSDECLVEQLTTADTKRNNDNNNDNNNNNNNNSNSRKEAKVKNEEKKNETNDSHLDRLNFSRKNSFLNIASIRSFVIPNYGCRSRQSEKAKS
jgi:hypothetical protein